MAFVFTLMGKHLVESVGRVVTGPSRAEVSSLSGESQRVEWRNAGGLQDLTDAGD